MSRLTRAVPILTLVLAFGLTLSWSPAAQARDWDHHSFFSFGISLPAPQPVVVQRAWVPGHYETRTESVLVQPQRVERQYVPPVVETRRDRYGRTFNVVVRQGYYQDVMVPAQYETRQVNMWVEGYYQDGCATGLVVAPPVYAAPRFGLRLHF